MWEVEMKRDRDELKAGMERGRVERVLERSGKNRAVKAEKKEEG